MLYIQLKRMSKTGLGDEAIKSSQVSCSQNGEFGETFASR